MAGKLQDIIDAVVDLDDETTVRLVKEKLEAGERPKDILEALTSGMNIVGDKYAAKEYFLSDLVMAAEVFQSAMKLIKPHLTAEETQSCGRIVIGTVEGDLHDIGKNIFTALAQNAGFQVIDLGVDVSPDKLAETVADEKADILAMSGILTMSADPMKKAVEILKEQGLRDKVRVIIGGLPVDEMWRKEVGADAAT
ncbi:MAG: cobalamin-dependent protein, partial [Actinomycetota bacterium]